MRSWDALTGSTLRKHVKKGSEVCSLVVLDRCAVQLAYQQAWMELTRCQAKRWA